MTGEPLERIEALFQAAADLPDEQRLAFLDRACEGNVELRRRVEALLEQMDRDSLIAPTIERPPQLVEAEEPGTTIDRYKLLQRIGEGGFGAVFMAEQLEPVSRKVALKVIKLGMDTKEVVARFEAERQALAMMDHPNIAKVLDAGSTASGRPYFVMELVRGVPITEYCDQNRLPTEARLQLFEQVCHAVQHAHQKGVIHRDIKPSNVMVTLHDGRPVPKVIDFGIAKAMHTRLTEKTLFTEYQRFIGTPAYMSPEQAEMSALDVDTRTDVYSLGVLLYELLTGTTPFDTTSLLRAGMAEVQRVLREESPERPSMRISSTADASIAEQRSGDALTLSRTLKGDLDWIVMKALEKDRTRRYGTASEFADDLRRHREQQPVLAGPPSAAYRMRKFLARNRAAVVPLAVLTLGLIGGVIGLAWGLIESQRAEKRIGEEAARFKAEAAYGRVVTDFLVGTLALADPSITQSSELTVQALLDRASANVEQQLSGQPRAEARVRATIGRAYEKLGESVLAEPHLRRAVELMDQLGSASHHERYDALWTLTNVLFINESPDAYVFASRARDTGLAFVGERYPELARSMQAFGDKAWDHDVAGAVAIFHETARIARTSVPQGDRRWSAIADTFKAGALANWYRPDEGLTVPFYDETVVIQSRELGPEHPDTHDTVTLLVGLLTRIGRAAEAEQRLRDSLQRMQGVLPADSRDIAFAESLLGENLVAQGKYEDAEDLLLRSHARLLMEAGERNFFALDSYGRVIALYAEWGKADEASRYREELARIGAEGHWIVPWPILSRAFAPEQIELLERLEKLHELCGRDMYTGSLGSLADAASGELLLQVVSLRKQLLADDAPLAVALARSLVQWGLAFAPDQLLEPRRRILQDAALCMRSQAARLPLESADLTAQLTTIARHAGEAEEADRLALETWRQAQSFDAAESWLTANAKVRIGRCLAQSGLRAEAEGLLRVAHAELQKQFGDRHRATIVARQELERLGGPIPGND